MSAAELPIDERQEPLLDDSAFDPSGVDGDQPTDPDALAPRETTTSLGGPDQPLGAGLSPAGQEPPVLDFTDGLEVEPPRAPNRPKFLPLAAGLLVAALLFAALAALLQSSEPQSEPASPSGDSLEAAPAPTPTETLREELTADIKSIQARLAQQQQERQAVTAEVDALRAQVEQIRQAPGSAAQLEERLATLESRLAALSDVELFVGVVGARLDELAARITFLDDVLSQMRQHGNAQGQSAPPPPRVDLPFHLAAIEAWDGRLYASLLHDGRQILVQPGDACAGWTVQSIDGARREVLFVRDGVRAVRRAPK